MFEKEADLHASIMAWNEDVDTWEDIAERSFKKGAEFGYNKANEWHFVKDGDLPKQDGNTCFSIEVLADNKKWVYYRFDSGKWFCGNKVVKVKAWKEIVI